MRKNARAHLSVKAVNSLCLHPNKSTIPAQGGPAFLMLLKGQSKHGLTVNFLCPAQNITVAVAAGIKAMSSQTARNPRV